MWSHYSFHDEHILASSYFLIVTLLLLISFLLQHYINHVAKWSIPNAIVPITLGLAVSAIFNFSGGYRKHDFKSHSSENEGHTGFDASIIELDNSTFFFAFLPPMIFNSGYHLKRRLLYENFDAILALAFVGTTISLLTVAFGLSYLQDIGLLLPGDNLSIMELIAFGALISSTDPISTLAVFGDLHVDSQLFYLVLGESLLNDAICVTVYNSASRYISAESLHLRSVVWTIVADFLITSLLSAMLGYGAGLALAWLMKVSVSLSTHSLMSVILLLLMAWLPFFLSEALQLSGIVAVLFTGIAVRRYVTKNMGKIPALRASFVMSLASDCAETATFLLLGLSVFSQNYSAMRWDFVLYALIGILASRALHVYPLLALINVKRWLWSGGLRAKHSDSREQQQESNLPLSASIRAQTSAGLDDQTMDAPAAVAQNAEAESSTQVALLPQTVHKYSRIQPLRIHTPLAIDISNMRNTATHNLQSYGIDSDRKAEYDPIPLRSMHATFLAGMRGAVSFSLATIFSDSRGHQALVLGTTTMIILLTFIVQGGFTESMIRCLGIPINVQTPEGGQNAERYEKDLDLEERYFYPLFLRNWIPTSLITTETTGCTNGRTGHARRSARGDMSAGTQSSGGGPINHESSADIRYSSPLRAARDSVVNAYQGGPTRRAEHSLAAAPIDTSSDSDTDASKSLVTSHDSTCSPSESVDSSVTLDSCRRPDQKARLRVLCKSELREENLGYYLQEQGSIHNPDIEEEMFYTPNERTQSSPIRIHVFDQM